MTRWCTPAGAVNIGEFPEALQGAVPRPLDVPAALAAGVHGEGARTILFQVENPALRTIGRGTPARGARRSPSVSRPLRRTLVRHEVVVSGLLAAAASGIPSTVCTLAEGGDVLEGARAAGTLLAPRARSTPVLLAAAVPVHLALSLGWAAVLAAVLPHGREPVYGPLGGLAIAALDLEVIGRRFPAIRALPQGRQWADHLAYGLSVGVALRCHRSSN